jgi:hypothetical protein
LNVFTGNRSADAARTEAERRWSADLHERYGSTPDVYGEIITSIDSAMQSAATDAELKRHGAGVAYIIERLRLRVVR